MRIARVFVRRTRATPVGPLVFIGRPGLFPPEVDAVYVSVAFTWDIPEANRIALEWEKVAPVYIGGPAIEQTLDPFVPGLFLEFGWIITSRGCPNKPIGPCWFCKVPPGPVELPITEGWNVADDNFIACSELHISRVCDMLRRQKRAAEFTGGIEAARLTPAKAEALRSVRPKQLFLAYDTPDDWEPLVQGAEMLWKAGFTKASHAVRCYVLVGFPKDTMKAAEARMTDCLGLGLLPMAMLWRDRQGNRNPAWRTFQRIWARPASVANHDYRRTA